MSDDVPVIDGKGAGYFGCPPPSAEASFTAALAADPVVAFERALQDAKEGRFDSVARIMEIYDPEREDSLSHQCTILLGDAGPESAFAPLIHELDTNRNSLDYQVVIHYCHALAIRGRLADIPIQIAAFEPHADVPDMAIVAVRIARMLEPRPGPLSKHTEWPTFAGYRQAVLARSKELAEELGGEHVLVFKGQAYGVIPLAKYILCALTEAFFASDYRLRFEAATGINCSAFYQDGALQPLAAAEIVERFLENLSSDNFELGVRYFFGHRIPG